MTREQFARQVLIVVLLLTGEYLLLATADYLFFMTSLSFIIWFLQYYIPIIYALTGIVFGLMCKKGWKVSIPLAVLTALVPDMGAILYLIVVAYPVFIHEPKTR